MDNNLHEKTFEFLENYRKNNPKFTYWLRERNTKGRLDDGMWFQGDGNYVSVGLYNQASGNLSTQSISFILMQIDGKIEGFVEILYKNENDPKLINFYKEIIKTVEGFKYISPGCYKKSLGDDAFKGIREFLDFVKPKIDEIIYKRKLGFLIITEDVFQKKMDKIKEYRDEDNSDSNLIQTLLVNISWNSNNWQGESNDPSNHGWVKSGGTANESWNFDFNNPRNTQDEIYGFAKFTNTPKVSGNNNLLIFHSKNKIVGFYGKAQVFPYSDAINENNLIGYRPMCVLLKNKIDDIKEKGYLEEGKRIGQGGFNYLKSNENIAKIINEATLLNPEVKQKLDAIKEWMNLELKLKPNYWLFQANPEKTYDIFGALEKGILNEWLVNQHKKTIKLGDRIVLWVSGKKAGVYGIATVTSDVYTKDANSEEKEYYIDKSKLTTAERVTLKLDLNLVFNPILKTDLNNPLHESIVNIKQGTNFSITEQQFNILLEMARKKLHKYFPLNQILFGPPGTGKTYNTINKALEFIGVDVANLDRKSIKEEFDKKMKEDQIVFTTFHQSMSYEDFIEGIKPKTNNDGNVTYDIEDGIFKLISNKAEINYLNSLELSSDFDEVFEILKTQWIESDNSEIDVKMKGNSFWITNITNRNIKFRKPSGGTGHDLVIKTLKDLYDNKRQMDSGLAIYYYPLIEKLRSFSKKSNKKNEIKNYVLIIDEINRGNVSQIFGELITLIEEDKRIGKDEALELTLPYSKESFGVPPNLYLIGTMNTADRSVEAIDTALRRRFSFTEMPPRYDLDLLTYDYAGTTGKVILETINARIEKLLDKDHLIGHSFFLKKEDEDAESKLKNSFYRNIIPLLQEYFYGDYAKIGAVLGSGFVKLKEEKGNDKLFAEFDGFESGDYIEKNTYQIIDYRLVETNYSIKKDGKLISMDFEKAIKLLINMSVD